MKGTIRVDHINKNIIISKAFANASKRIDTEEYKTLLNVKTAYSDYLIIQREIKKNPQKECYCGLTYDYMEKYIKKHDFSGEIMKVYEELRLRASCHSIRYAHIKKWFLETYPEIDDFAIKTKRTDKKRSAA